MCVSFICFRFPNSTLLCPHLGGEGEGLSRELRLHCEVMLTIPSRRDLHPGVESLNVSVATGKSTARLSAFIVSEKEKRLNESIDKVSRVI